MKLTKEKAIEYFNAKASKVLLEKGIVTIDEYHVQREQDEEERVIFVINDCYMIRYIVPQAFNCLMRNQSFKEVLKGWRTSKKDIRETVEYWRQKGWVKEVR